MSLTTEQVLAEANKRYLQWRTDHEAATAAGLQGIVSAYARAAFDEGLTVGLHLARDLICTDEPQTAEQGNTPSTAQPQSSGA